MKITLFRLILSIILLFSIVQFTTSKNNQDFSTRGFHIDLRCQVMTMPALKSFAKDLSEMGINTIIMEWEASFPYTRNATLSNKYAYSKEEVKSFVSYCSSLGIDVIPLQNCFGHVEYILRHDRYSQIKEDSKEISQVCPSKTMACKTIFTDIFSEMAELHTSKYFHIGCDETRLLGTCKQCALKVKNEGKSKLFVDYVNLMCDIARSMGKQPIIWADIILKYPEAIKELPKDIIFVDWNYGWSSDKFGDMNNLLKSGITIWGAPSIRSAPDNIYLTQWNKHFSNINTFIPYSRKANYQGIVMTSWSTSGTYGFSYDTGWEVINMLPIRWVYPLSGFRISVAAYAESLKNEEPLDTKKFTISYAQERFGLSSTDSELLWKILNHPQETIRNGKESKSNRTISEVKEEFITLQKQLSSLKPIRNQKEFDHFRLMFDIRIEYLSFKEIESKYQSNEFNRNKADNLFKELETLKTKTSEINQRFISLNKNFLHDDELKEINRVRNEKFLILHETIKKMVQAK